MSEPNSWAGKSRNELLRQKALIDEALEADEAKLDVVAAQALKWAMARLKAREKLGESWTSISAQAFPKEMNLAKPGGLSESQVSNIGKAVKAALEKAAG